MTRAIVFFAFLIAMFGVLRNCVFNVPGVKEAATEKLYEKPLYLGQWILPDDKVPTGFERTSPKPPDIKPTVLDIEAGRRYLGRDALPPEGLKNLIALEYQAAGSPRLTVVVARYESAETVKNLLEQDSWITPPHYLAFGPDIAWFSTSEGSEARAFRDAYAPYLEDAQSRRRNFEKVVVAGNAYLKLFTNLAVGVMALALIFYFLKVYLINRQVEEF